MVPTSKRNPPYGAAQNSPAEEPQVELSMYNVTSYIDRSAMILLHLVHAVIGDHRQLLVNSVLLSNAIPAN